MLNNVSSDRLATLTSVLICIASITLTVVFLATGERHPAGQVRQSPPPRTPGDVVVPHWRDLINHGHRIGPPTSRVVILEFGDYQCPFCKQVQAAIAAVLKEFPDVAFEWRHMPLNSHRAARHAARMAICADEVGRFPQMHSLLLHIQDSLNVLTASALAARAGLADTTTFLRCLEDRETEMRLEADEHAARTLKVRGTPAILINDRLLIDLLPDSAELSARIRNAATDARQSARRDGS